MKMELFSGFFNCSCRRRTVINKCFPFVLQAFVVIGVWQILKSQMTLSDETSTGRSLRSAEKSLCSHPEDVTEGKSLHLQTLLSPGSTDPQSQNFLHGPHFLSVEVFVRDAVQGSCILYPVGTPVIVSAKTAEARVPENVGGLDYKDVNVVEKNYDNNVNVVETAHDKNSNIVSRLDAPAAAAVYDVLPGGLKLEDGVIKAPDSNILPLESDTDYNYGNVQGSNENKDSGKIDTMVVEEEMIPIEFKEKISQQQNSRVIDENTDFQLDKAADNNFVAKLQNPVSASINGNILSSSGRQSQVAMRSHTPASHSFHHQNGRFYDEQLMLAANEQGDTVNMNISNQPMSQTRGTNHENLPPKVLVSQTVQTVMSEQQIAATTKNMVVGRESKLSQSDQVFGQAPTLDQVFGQGPRLSQSDQVGQRSSLNKVPGAGHAIRFNSHLDDGIETLYTEGFSERVQKFKSELFDKAQPDLGPAVVRIPNVSHLNNPDACGIYEKVDIIYLIKSNPQNDEPRQRIRETFADSANFQPFTIAHVFLMGTTNSISVHNTLNIEQEKYGDILRGEFQNSAENGTLTVLMGMQWVSQYCRHAKFVMKIEDDVFVDSDKLVRGLIPAANKSIGKRAILCPFNSEGPISRLGPNAIPMDFFPTRTKLRPYCRGYAILMTREIVPILLAASEHVPLFAMEDLYLFGILPFVAGGIEVFDLGNKRAFHDFGVETVSCYRDQKDKCPIVASRALGGRYTALWNMVKGRMLEGPEVSWEDSQSLWNVKSYKRNF